MAKEPWLRPSEVELLRQCLADGMTTREAAEHLGRCRRSIMTLMKRHKLTSSHLQVGRQHKDEEGNVYVTTRLGITRRRGGGGTV